MILTCYSSFSVVRHSPLATVITGLSLEIRHKLEKMEKVISEITKMIDECTEK